MLIFNKIMIASNSLIIDTIKYDEINVVNYQHLSRIEPKKSSMDADK